jgi:F0F1-type ATP synthase membrane subunit b/b'
MLALGIVMVLLVVVVFIGLVMFMQKVLSKDVTSATCHLDKLSEEYAQKEAAIKQQFEEAKRQSQEIIANAQKDSQKQKDELIRNAQEEKEKIVAEAHHSAEEVIRQADNARLALLAEVEQKINDGALQKASELLQVAIPEEIKSGIHAVWTDSIISASFEKLDRNKIPGDLSEIPVVSAFALDARQRGALTQKLKEKLGFEITLVEQVDPRLVAGFIVTLGSLSFDGSLKFRIEEVARGRQ